MVDANALLEEAHQEFTRITVLLRHQAQQTWCKKATRDAYTRAWRMMMRIEEMQHRHPDLRG